jgi:hypothetical protein
VVHRLRGGGTNGTEGGDRLILLESERSGTANREAMFEKICDSDREVSCVHVETLAWSYRQADEIAIYALITGSDLGDHATRHARGGMSKSSKSNWPDSALAELLISTVAGLSVWHHGIGESHICL